MATYSKAIWQQARDAICLGATMRDVAAEYGINFETLRDRARRENWPRPDKMPPAEIPVTAAPVVAARSLAQRGEQHRALIADMVEKALQQASATPPALNSWQDIQIAAKLGNTALGLDSPAAPVVSLTFPASSSSEVSQYIDISSTNFSPSPRRDPIPEALPLPHASDADRDQ